MLTWFYKDAGMFLMAIHGNWPHGSSDCVYLTSFIYYHHMYADSTMIIVIFWHWTQHTVCLSLRAEYLYMSQSWCQLKWMGVEWEGCRNTNELRKAINIQQGLQCILLWHAQVPHDFTRGQGCPSWLQSALHAWGRCQTISMRLQAWPQGTLCKLP